MTLWVYFASIKHIILQRRDGGFNTSVSGGGGGSSSSSSSSRRCFSYNTVSFAF